MASISDLMYIREQMYFICVWNVDVKLLEKIPEQHKISEVRRYFLPYYLIYQFLIFSVAIATLELVFSVRLCVSLFDIKLSK